MGEWVRREDYITLLEAAQEAHKMLAALQKYLDPDHDSGHMHGLNAFRTLTKAFRELGIRP